jgi:hypothetical protein
MNIADQIVECPVCQGQGGITDGVRVTACGTCGRTGKVSLKLGNDLCFRCEGVWVDVYRVPDAINIPIVVRPKT